MDKTVLKSLKLIEALGRSQKPRGIADLAGELGLGKSNVHRLLDTLTGAGYVKRHVEQGRYELTLRLWEIGAAVLDRLDVRMVAREPMEWLAEKTGESVHLCVLDGIDAVHIERIQGSRPLSAFLKIGGRAPAHRTASGKTLLSGLSDDALNSMLSRVEPPLSSAAHTSFIKEVAKIRAVGYALNHGTYRPEVSGAGAPIYHAGNQVIAAIGISGPTTRLTPRRLASLGSKEVVEAARRISAALGKT
jgi:DNA-binding IclR family transcriptional regulator